MIIKVFRNILPEKFSNLLDKIVLMHEMTKTLILVGIGGCADLTFVFLGCTTFVSQMSQQIRFTRILTIAIVRTGPSGLFKDRDLFGIICKPLKMRQNVSENLIFFSNLEQGFHSIARVLL